MISAPRYSAALFRPQGVGLSLRPTGIGDSPILATIRITNGSVRMGGDRAQRKVQQGQCAIVVAGHHNTDMIDFLGQFDIDGVWLEGEHGRLSWGRMGE